MVFFSQYTDTTTDNQIVDSHIPQTIYQCSNCQEQFNDKDSYSAHAASHKENLRCPDCHKVFNKPSLLKRHMIVHFGRKEFTCQICQKSYTQKATLQAHMGWVWKINFCFVFTFVRSVTTKKLLCCLNWSGLNFEFPRFSPIYVLLMSFYFFVFPACIRTVPLRSSVRIVTKSLISKRISRPTNGNAFCWIVAHHRTTISKRCNGYTDWK